MNKKFFIFLFILVPVVLFVWFLSLKSDEGVWLCKDNQWVKNGNLDSCMPISGCVETKTVLPDGYTIDKYVIEKSTDISCFKNSDCKTPSEYLLQSRCPFTSLCLKNKCSVVCPSMKI